MTVAELMDILKEHDEDKKVVFTLNCDNNFRNIDDVRTSYTGEFIVLEGFDIPNEDDLASMIEASLQERKRYMTDRQKKILKDFLNTFRN